MSRSAVTSTPVHPLLAERWSPRSFDPSHEVTAEQLTALLEAARWAASAFNGQPWRFIVGRRGDEAHKVLFDSLLGFNQRWAGTASVLVAAVAAEVKEDGSPHSTAAYETGLAVAQLTTQAHAEGLHAHQMSGFDGDRLRAAVGIPEGFRPIAVIAVGAPAAADLLADEKLRARESAPRERRALAETFFAASWGTPAELVSAAGAG
jgi:nitroreductase